MTLSLTIENYKNLPDGGPTSVTVSGRRGIDIGRDSSLDWTLPDPNRAISGKHCEIRYEDGGFVLHDVSLNGTFLNGAPGRMQAPHRLRNGDRLVIGEYIIAVKLDQADEAAAYDSSSHPVPWRELRPLQAPPHAPDVFDWSMDVEMSWLPPPHRRTGEKSRTAARTNSFGARDVPHVGYPRWLVMVFPVSLVAFLIGLLSALYIVLVSFSAIALAGTYLIPFGLTALYYLLGAAERRAS